MNKLKFLLFFLYSYIVCSNRPEYLSIEANSEEAFPEVLRFVEDALEHLSMKHYEITFKEDISEMKKRHFKHMRKPDSWHTTCLYIGKDSEKMKGNIFKNWKNGQSVELISSTFIYVPGKIMIAPVFFDNFDLIENKFPHITLFVGKFKAVDSNYVLNALFGEEGEHAELYKNGRIKDPLFEINSYVENVTIKFENTGKEEMVNRVYILKFGKKLSLEGFTKTNYRRILEYLE